MGEIYDVIKVDENARCSNVKPAIIYFTLIGCPVSFIFLLIGIIRMIINRKVISFSTQIIIFIFSSEIVNIISKMLQLLKYSYEDTRENYENNNSVETPRGIICQIQIVTSIVSDFCSLLGSLLLSIRCLDVIKKKTRFFDGKKIRIFSFVTLSIASIILAIIFLLIDKTITSNSIGFKFDLRDRCTYWCWLDHITSIICYSVYTFILILNIIYVRKTNYYLKEGYNQLLDQSVVLVGSLASSEESERTKSGAMTDKDEKLTTHNYRPKEFQKRIEEYKIMKIKCSIYPITTIIIWIILFFYRLIDDIIFIKFDNYESIEDMEKEEYDEGKYLNDRPSLKGFVQVLLVTHSFLSSMRGIFYGFSFIIFEEKSFGNCFRKLLYKCCCCFKKDEFTYIGENDDDNDNNRLMKNTTNENRESDTRESHTSDTYRVSNASYFRKNFNDANISAYQ